MAPPVCQVTVKLPDQFICLSGVFIYFFSFTLMLQALSQYCRRRMQLTSEKGGRQCNSSPTSAKALPQSQLRFLPNSAGFAWKPFPEYQFITVGLCSLAGLCSCSSLPGTSALCLAAVCVLGFFNFNFFLIFTLVLGLLLCPHRAGSRAALYTT